MKLWTGANEELLNLAMGSYEFPIKIDLYESLVKNIRPENSDNWCVSNECKFHRQKNRSPIGKLTLNLKDNDAKMAFAIAGYGILSFKHGKKLLAT